MCNLGFGLYISLQYVQNVCGMNLYAIVVIYSHMKFCGIFVLLKNNEIFNQFGQRIETRKY